MSGQFRPIGNTPWRAKNIFVSKNIWSQKILSKKMLVNKKIVFGQQ